MTVHALPIDLGYDHASLRIRCTLYQAAERVLLANQQLKGFPSAYRGQRASQPLQAISRQNDKTATSDALGVAGLIIPPPDALFSVDKYVVTASYREC